jgi:hypothetical protein
MSIAFDTKSLDQTNAILQWLGESVGLASADRNDQSWISGDIHFLLNRPQLRL